MSVDLVSHNSPLTVRRFVGSDADFVRRFWTEGFLELSWDLTRTLGPVYAGPGSSTFRFPRPLLLAIGFCGVLGGVRAIANSKCPPKRFVSAFLLGFGGLALMQMVTTSRIRSMCDHECTKGDMFDIACSWQKQGVSDFFVAEIDGQVVGSIAVRLGGFEWYFNQHATNKTDEAIPSYASVWKVSTAHQVRGKGVAKALMNTAEAWAIQHAATKMMLITGSPGAKQFYNRVGYSLKTPPWSMHGTEVTIWEKKLQE